ncbi:ArsR family transcriptional regulator [Nocardia sp. MH4]|uniref:ArsR/SmtB family transcription factor n=1 Tax=Nocardia TaxID=1817 RepID=UPI001C4E5A9B|nr:MULTISPECIES: metalloregulator ArsR/SmtB family transcription factor [Nocardia]MBW0273741.1 ArsR family transcriptional regulator [Nocardia sp. MH4]
MPKYSGGESDGGLDSVFRALADPTRRAIVERLARGPASVSDLAAPFEVALPTIVQHLKALEAGRIVSSAKIGRVRTYQLAPGAFGSAIDWLRQQRPPAERQLDRLTALLMESVNNAEGEQQ